MLGILSFSDWERALPHSTEISELTFLVKKSTMILSSGCLVLEKQRENFKLNLVLVVVLVLRFKALLIVVHLGVSEIVRGEKEKVKR